MHVKQWVDVASARFPSPTQLLGALQGSGDFGTRALTAYLQAVTSALLMNICIVGINQVGL